MGSFRRRAKSGQIRELPRDEPGVRPLWTPQSPGQPVCAGGAECAVPVEDEPGHVCIRSRIAHGLHVFKPTGDWTSRWISPDPGAETYVDVGCSRSAWVAKYADRQEPVQTLDSTPRLDAYSCAAGRQPLWGKPVAWSGPEHRLPSVGGRINEEDIAAVRDRARIEEIVGSYVTLRSAGGTMKGLCPFHDEKTPSFQVTPSRGYWYCFGACAEGGDVIDFMCKIDNLSFVEAVERLADRVGIQLRYTDDTGPRPEPGARTRMAEALRLAAEFFVEQLGSADAVAARQFLSDRGFDREAAERFDVGFSPRDGRALLQHLRGRGFRDAELISAGLARESGWDFFQGRVMWPIRDSGRQVLGFGARRLFEDDRMPSKYINTPETVLYKKSHVLYGLELARTAISKKSQAVVVEGYTDVMAAHLSGVDTAVASCGTAFGDDHARLLRRLMGNHDAFRGEVIFTFDGDAAGQAAALKVFAGDQNFVTQTYVAIEPTGLDPCDLRLQRGDAAVRELVARRVPLYRFVMSNVLKQHDLDRADGRLAALRSAAPSSQASGTPRWSLATPASWPACSAWTSRRCGRR